MNWDANAHYRDTKVATEYDAARFSSFAGRIFNNLEKRIIRRSFEDLPRTAMIVDVPCGTGRLAEPLLEVGFKVHGMDISQEMLDVARSRLARFGDSFTTEVGDARRLVEGEDARFDAALCARVLMHFPLEEQIEFLRGVAHVVRGRMVLSQSLSSPYQRGRRSIKRFLGHQAPARYPITNSEMAVLLERSGLAETRRYRLGPPISEAVYVVAQRHPRS